MKLGRVVKKLQEIQTIVDTLLGELEGMRSSKEVAPARAPRSTHMKITFSFEMNPLAFMKKYGRRVSGPKKFTLLLARLAKGSESAHVPAAELRKTWNKMKSVMGDSFNPAYANRAKANGWVDAPKHGSYALTSSWKDAF